MFRGYHRATRLGSASRDPPRARRRLPVFRASDLRLRSSKEAGVGVTAVKGSRRLPTPFQAPTPSARPRPEPPPPGSEDIVLYFRYSTRPVEE